DALDLLPEAWTTARLFELPVGSLLRSALSRRVSAGDRRTLELAPTLCPGFLRSEGETFDKLLRKSSLRRKTVGLAALGHVEIAHLEQAGEIEAELDGFFRQHVERWSVTPNPSLFLEPEVCAFYRGLARGLETGGHVILTVVRLDGRPVAYHFGLADGDRF